MVYYRCNTGVLRYGLLKKVGTHPEARPYDIDKCYGDDALVFGAVKYHVVEFLLALVFAGYYGLVGEA